MVGRLKYTVSSTSRELEPEFELLLPPEDPPDIDVPEPEREPELSLPRLSALLAGPEDPPDEPVWGDPPDPKISVALAVPEDPPDINVPGSPDDPDDDGPELVLSRLSALPAAPEDPPDVDVPDR
jgi:hypothetical protein